MNSDIKKYIKEAVKKMLERPEIAPAPVKPGVKPNVTPGKPTPKKNPLQIPTTNPDNLPMPRPKAESTEVAPAKPETSPEVKPEKPAIPQRKKNPLQIPTTNPDNLPMPRPKAKFDNISFDQYLTNLSENITFHRFLKERAPMDFDPTNRFRPAATFQQGIENKGPSPFTNIEFLQKKSIDQSTLEKLGSEEFNSIVQNLQQIGNMSVSSIITAFGTIKTIEKRHRQVLERLAIDAVVQNFGLSDEVAERLRARLKDNISSGGGSDSPVKKAVAQMTPEEQKIADELVKKRVVQNMLMMGSGYRAHKLFIQIKPSLDDIDENLYPLYLKVMGNVEFHLWTTVFNPKSVPHYGKCQVDKNDMTVKAEASLFIILLHELAKGAVELLFLQSVFNIAEKHGEKMYNYVLDKADRLEEEQWMKLIGPRLWKYLHDAINFIVMERENDYTIVSYLLNKISLLSPREFLTLMDEVVNNGPVAINKLVHMLDEVERDIEEYEAQNNETPEPADIMPEPDLANFNSLMGQINDILNKGDNNPVKNEILNHKPFAQMMLPELQNYIKAALEAGEYDKAAEARDELEAREQ